MFGLTKFSDLSKDEFIDKYLQDDMYERIRNNSRVYERTDHSGESNEVHDEHLMKRSLTVIPKKVDW